MNRMSLETAKGLIEAQGFEFDREQKGYPLFLRYKNNHHVLYKFSNGHEIVHAGMTMKEENRTDIANILKSGYHEEFMNKRRENSAKTHTACMKAQDSIREEVAKILKECQTIEEVRVYASELEQLVAEHRQVVVEAV